MLQKNNLLRDLKRDFDSKKIPTQITINRKSLRLRHCSTKVGIDDLVSWFVVQSYFPKIYFYDCHTRVPQVALGSLFSTQEFPEITILDNPYSLDPKLYGGVGYLRNSGQSSIWQNFPNSSFILPQVEIEKIDDTLWIHLWFILSTSEMSMILSMRDIISQLMCESSIPNAYWNPKVIMRKDLPDRSLWDRNVDDSVQQISMGKIDKVVLARQSSYVLQDLISLRAIIGHLQKIQCSLVFSIEFCPGDNFVGVTPEILYYKNESDVEIMALAGTASLGNSEYLYRIKEQREFVIVKEFIYSKMKDVCTTISWTPDTIRQISTLLHLCRIYRGTLHPSIYNADIIRALHPTPAISGFPQSLALDVIAKIEPFHRGWYAAPIGYTSSKKTQMYVAIRSALVRGNILHIFSGAGIVSDSIAKQEWEELDHKMAHFL